MKQTIQRRGDELFFNHDGQKWVFSGATGQTKVKEGTVIAVQRVSWGQVYAIADVRLPDGHVEDWQTSYRPQE